MKIQKIDTPTVRPTGDDTILIVCHSAHSARWKNENVHAMETRHHEEFTVFHANTERLKKSSIIHMQNLEMLNLNKRNFKFILNLFHILHVL